MKENNYNAFFFFFYIYKNVKYVNVCTDIFSIKAHFAFFSSLAYELILLRPNCVRQSCDLTTGIPFKYSSFHTLHISVLRIVPDSSCSLPFKISHLNNKTIRSHICCLISYCIVCLLAESPQGLGVSYRKLRSHITSGDCTGSLTGKRKTQLDRITLPLLTT